MRHLRSIFYALVLAPCIWVLLAVGFTDDLSSRGREFFTAESVSGLLLLIFAGILFSILAAGPVSPAGPVLAGAVYLGITLWAFNAPEAYASLWPAAIAKEGFNLSRPGYGLAAVLSVPLLLTALSARRWARYEPPVLPIIGEIGRFRGAARVAGTPVAAEQTTVIRTGVPADPTVAINHPANGADRTVAFNSVPPATPRTDRTEVVANNDRTVFVTQPPAPAPAAPKPVPAQAEPTTVLATGAGEPTVVQGKGLASGDEPTVVTGTGLAPAKPATASASVSAQPATASAPVGATPAKPAAASAPAGPAPAQPAAGSAAVAASPAQPAAASAPVSPAQAKPAAGSAPVAARPAKPATASVPVTATPATPPTASPEPARPSAGTDDETSVLTGLGDDRTSAKESPADADQDKTAPMAIPAAKPAEEPTVLVTPPAEPTAVIPAQRRPSATES